MSKTYFGRCAAVGVAGLTAMSSIAIVASAATQASLVYELKYLTLDSIVMNTNVGYATGSNQFCYRGANSVKINGGFNVDLTKLNTYAVTYNDVATGNPVAPVTAFADADFTEAKAAISKSVVDKDTWTYKAPKPADPTTPVAVILNELYNPRVAGKFALAFKTESDREAAKSAMISEIKKEYTTLATSAQRQFSSDINAIAKAAKTRIENLKKTELQAATDYLALNPTDRDTYNKMVQSANNKYSAATSAVNTATTKIISEFNQTFTANSFNYNLGFLSQNTPIVTGDSVGGYSPTLDAKYKGYDGAIDLDNARYWSGSTIRDANDAAGTAYVFKGEIQPGDVFTTGTSPFLYLGSTLSWINYEVIDNNSTTGGNTSPSGGSTSGSDTTTDDTDTKTTTWYPDSASYRAASEVSYLGKNGYWYTSSSAASVYGGGYTGTSKNSGFSTVNSSANGKAIYFNSTTGTYSTSSSSYSYIVKEATSTDNSNDPYYSYIWGNKNTTTTVPAGSPAISGASKYAGWTNISAYITNRGKSGSTYSINMNDESIVPASVLAAAKAKNVTLTFVNDNGSKVTVKPGKVSTTSDLKVSVTYNVKDIKTSLVNKAKKVNPGTVSTAQVRIGNDGSIGGTATVNVKFSTKRSGCTVKAYRLTASGSLVKEASGTVSSTGRVNLNLTKGGSYLLVVID